jgi:hypothetical protein
VATHTYGTRRVSKHAGPVRANCRWYGLRAANTGTLGGVRARCGRVDLSCGHPVALSCAQVWRQSTLLQCKRESVRTIRSVTTWSRVEYMRTVSLSVWLLCNPAQTRCDWQRYRRPPNGPPSIRQRLPSQPILVRGFLQRHRGCTGHLSSLRKHTKCRQTEVSSAVTASVALSG